MLLYVLTNIYLCQMQKQLLLTIFIFNCGCLCAQTTTLSEWNNQRLQHTERSMWVLGTWAAGNIAAGAIGMSRTTGETKAFHQMNLGWGLINAALAGSGIWTATHTDPAGLDWFQSLEAQQRLQRIFLFNAGLDVGYMMTGMWMMERSKNTENRPERLRGFGKSILMQGAFLFVFDLGAFVYHRPLDKSIHTIRPAIGMSGVNLTISLN
jgi:hypothetical protein